jgi:hypothetical protein
MGDFLQYSKRVKVKALRRDTGDYSVVENGVETIVPAAEFESTYTFDGAVADPPEPSPS